MRVVLYAARHANVTGSPRQEVVETTLETVDIDSLIAEIPESMRGEDGSVCGPELEYTDDYRELIDRAAPVTLNPETGEGFTREELEHRGERPDDTLLRKIPWPEVKRDAMELLGKSNDILIAEVLCRALLNADGFAGLHAGLKVFAGLIDGFWEYLHPSGVPYRLNIIASLGEPDPDKQSLVFHIRRAGLVELSELQRVFSLKDIEYATGAKSPPSGLKAEIFDKSIIDEAFQATPQDVLKRLEQDLAGCLEQVTRIESLCEGYGGSSNRLKDLTRQLVQVQDAVAKYIISADEPGTGEVALNGQTETGNIMESDTELNGTRVASANSGSRGTAGAITSRADVIQNIEAICAWYQNNEPSSPVPLILERAKKTVSMNFMEIVKEISPSGLDEVKNITGAVEATSTAEVKEE